MDDNRDSLEGDEYIVPNNLKPPSLASKNKKIERNDLSPPSTILSSNPSPNKSPVDTTPIIINGSEMSRDDFTPIVDEQHEWSEKESSPIKRLTEEYSVNDRSENLVNEFEFSKEIDLIQQPKTSYRRFNPPFPSGTYIQNVESTDASLTSPGPQPKISSPPSDISIDPRPIHHTNTTQKILQIADKKVPTPTQSPLKNIPDKIKVLEGSKTTSRPIVPGQLGQGQVQMQPNKYNPIIKSQPPRVQQTSAQQPSAQQTSPKPQPSPQQPSPSPMDTENKPLTEEELINRAHDYYLKYQILQKSWPEYKFPNLDERLVQTKPQIVIDSYTTSIERIQIDMDVSQYKIALIIMFLVIEVVCVKFMGFDAGGYTLSQIKAMNRYEKLLIEIGERKLLSGGDSWPPEVKILFIGLFNCALFILMKYLSSILGPQLISYLSPIVNGLFSGVLDTSKAASLPDEVPQRQQDISGMLGNVASMAANAFTNNSSQQPTSARTQQKASRRPVYRD